MSMSSKFLTESTGEKLWKLVNIAKIWTKYDSLVFLGHPVYLLLLLLLLLMMNDDNDCDCITLVCRMFHRLLW